MKRSCVSDLPASFVQMRKFKSYKSLFPIVLFIRSYIHVSSPHIPTEELRGYYAVFKM